MQTATPTDPATPPTAIVEQGQPSERPSSSEAPEQKDLFARAQRRKLPDERKSITHKFSIGGHEGDLIAGCMRKERRARSSSKWRRKAPRFRASWTAWHSRYPSDFSTACLSRLSSISQRIRGSSQAVLRRTRAFAMRVPCSITLPAGSGASFSRQNISSRGPPKSNRKCYGHQLAHQSANTPGPESRNNSATIGAAPSCSTCGMLMMPNGSCYKCVNCGSTSGCS